MYCPLEQGGGAIVIRQLHVPRGVFSGFGKRISSLIFGSQEATFQVKVCTFLLGDVRDLVFQCGLIVDLFISAGDSWNGCDQHLCWERVSIREGRRGGREVWGDLIRWGREVWSDLIRWGREVWSDLIRWGREVWSDPIWLCRAYDKGQTSDIL